MRHQRVGVALLLLVGLLFGDVRSAGAQTSADLFDLSTVQELRLLINTRDLAQLRAHFLDNTYYAADVIWRNMRVRNIGIRSRGVGSRDAVKLGLKLEFDKYTTGQTFLGLHTLVLRNLVQDPSMIREQVDMALFAKMGQPSSRESYAKLYINGEYQGLYGVVEAVDASYLQRTIGENTGYLFNYQWMFEWHAEYLGDDIETYKPILKPETHTTDPDTILFTPIRDLFKEISGPLDASWRDRVGALVDLQQFVTYVAIENFTAEWDGMTGNWGMNNFYMYRSANSPKHRFILWDRSDAFLQADSDIFLRTDLNLLFSRAMTFPDLRTLYLDTLTQCANVAAQDGWLAAQMTQAAALIADAAHQDTHKPFSNDDFDAGVSYLLNWAAFRPDFVLRAVSLVR